MCEPCHSLTTILIAIISDTGRLQTQLAHAQSTSDTERIDSLEQALAENTEQLRINRKKIMDHIAREHPEVLAPSIDAKTSSA